MKVHKFEFDRKYISIDGDIEILNTKVAFAPIQSAVSFKTSLKE